MPVDSKHKSYEQHVVKWERIRDTLAGVDEVKRKGVMYLPKPSGHTDEDYTGYLMRAEFYPASQRTVDGLAGAVFRKDPLFIVPDGSEDILDAVTLPGASMESFSKAVTKEVLSMGRYGVLVDVQDEGQSFLCGYSAENIINWRVMMVGREPVLQMVVLEERVTKIKDEDPYATETIEQYRVLRLGALEEGGALVYIVDVYQKSKETGGKESFILMSSTAPLRRGVMLDAIPFFFFGPTDLVPEIQKSPILDLVDTNLSHYRTSSELEEGAYFTGLPMYVVAGKPLNTGSETVTEFRVGSRSALMLDEGGTAEVLTVSGEGMGLLRSLMADKEQRMAVLGARILEDQKSGVEAAATVQMRHRGENSLLASISATTSTGLSRILELMLWWNGADNAEASVELNRDFVGNPMTPREIIELTASFQQGSIGPEVFFKALKDGERVPNDWTMEDWLADIDEGATVIERSLSNEGDINEGDE